MILARPKERREELLKRVPAHLRGMVETYIKIADERAEGWCCSSQSIADGRDANRDSFLHPDADDYEDDGMTYEASAMEQEVEKSQLDAVRKLCRQTQSQLDAVRKLASYISPWLYSVGPPPDPVNTLFLRWIDPPRRVPTMEEVDRAILESKHILRKRREA